MDRGLDRREKVDYSDGFFGIKDPEGQRLLPRLIAEYATAGVLIAGAAGLLSMIARERCGIFPATA